MRGYDVASYGDHIAESYDQWLLEDAASKNGIPDPEDVVNFLTRFIAGGNVLELGIGTGRIAIPLARRGVRIHGIECSPEMIARLRAKAGGEEIPVYLGDFSQLQLDMRFTLVFAVYSVLQMLTTQEAQLRCFENVAKHLSVGGLFVVEQWVPDIARFTRDQCLDIRRLDVDQVILGATVHDQATQTAKRQQIVISPAGIQFIPIVVRYIWPSELDLMARLAGFTLCHRWSDFNEGSFTSTSTKHISVYKRLPHSAVNGPTANVDK